MKLYEINAAIEQALEQAIDFETGEILHEGALQLLEELEMAKEKKIENIFLLAKSYKASAEAIKKEKLALANRQKIEENKAESLLRYGQSALNGEKFKTAKVDVSYRTTKSVNIDDVWKIPEEYLAEQEPKPDKKKIMDAIKNGNEVEGASLCEKTSVIVR